MDGDDMFDEAEEQQWRNMLLAGYSTEQIDQVKQRKRDKEDVRIYKYMVQQHAWDFDISCDRVDVHLKLARALDAICCRSDAIELLTEATEEDHPFDSRMFMALAKLLFREDQKELSLQYCEGVINKFLDKMEQTERIEQQLQQQQQQAGKNEEDEKDEQQQEEILTLDDALKAYYLSGWIRIHDDDHTKAYQIWSEGHRVIPSCPVLRKQSRKRECWDQDPSNMEEWMLQIPGLLTIAADDSSATTTSSSESDTIIEKISNSSESDSILESFSVTAAVVPPLALFSPLTQGRRLVFRTKEPLMSVKECSSVMRIVDQHVENNLGGKWGTVRHSSVKTTDVAVEDITALRPWLLALLHSKLYPLLSAAFPALADGTTLIDPETNNSRLRVHDAFIVRYDAINDKSLSLPEHCDTSSMSVIFALNEEDTGDIGDVNSFRGGLNGDLSDGVSEVMNGNLRGGSEGVSEESGLLGGGQSKEQESLSEDGQRSVQGNVQGSYKGGGTWFEALGPRGVVVDAGVGQAVMFAGPMKHAGYPISSGVRNILVLFLYVEGFHYGPYLRDSRLNYSGGGDDGEKGVEESVLDDSGDRGDAMGGAGEDGDGWEGRGSGAAKGGFVVYRQTVELVSMLEGVYEESATIVDGNEGALQQA